MKIDGSLGKLRTADELYEEATSSFLEAGSENVDDKDPYSCMSTGDLNRFWSLECTKKAMNRICEVKGARNL